jgi:hypothetical protein
MARRAFADTADPAIETAGVAGNGRLTETTGMLLALLLLVEGFTILDVRGYITLHAAIGLVLLGPVALKCASTGYRFARYYTGHAAYVRKGPPNVLLRVLGPFVVLSTLAVLGTGIALLADHGSSGTWLSLHQASFIVWVALTGLHFLAHLQGAAVGTARDLRRATGDPATRGKALRWLTVGAALIVGVGLAAAFTPSASSWQLHQHDHGFSRDH